MRLLFGISFRRPWPTRRGVQRREKRKFHGPDDRWPWLRVSLPLAKSFISPAEGAAIVDLTDKQLMLHTTKETRAVATTQEPSAFSAQFSRVSPRVSDRPLVARTRRTRGVRFAANFPERRSRTFHRGEGPREQSGRVSCGRRRTVAEQQVRIPRSKVRGVRAHGEHVASRRRTRRSFRRRSAPMPAPVLGATTVWQLAELNDRPVSRDSRPRRTCLPLELDRSKPPRARFPARVRTSPDGRPCSTRGNEKRRGEKYVFPSRRFFRRA